MSNVKRQRPDDCPCGKGWYSHGSALYDYYTCGHAYEKPLGEEKKGKWIYYPSPYGGTGKKVREKTNC